MKKTIITLFALCGAASATTTDATLVWDLSFNAKNQAVVTNGSGDDYSSLTITMNGSTVTDGICATPADNRVTITDSAATLRMMDSFSFVVQGGADVAVSNWGVLFGLGEDNIWNIKVANNTSGNLTLLEESYSISDKVGSTATPYGSMGTYIVTVDNGGKTQAQASTSALTLYYNGVEVATGTLGAANCTAQPLDTFALGGRNRETSNATDFSFTNVQLYSGVLSATQISQLSVPEPTTATLSLLALAGLAARRRRR
ncbi:MAG: PEP-CTERM sorting domain-containing protein [Akkermansia sp.]|nr:PEP-CTERM sorting domain-containing protein [Akkermansia sp.]